MIILWIFLSALIGLIIGGLLGTSKRADLVNEVRILRAKLYKAEEEKEELKQMIADFPWREKISQTTSKINSKAINSEEEA